MKGIVYWITGLSGAGKTTIGTKLYYKIKEKTPQAVLLDGDVVKMVFNENNADYSKDGRKNRAYQYARLCKMLSDQGITVICCTISMFDEVRNWNRDNIDNYFETFIDVDLSLLQKRDVKGLYKVFTDGSQAMVDSSWEFPKNPDLIIKNKMDNNIESNVNEILLTSSKINPDEDFKAYWDNYYSNNKAPIKPSDFAEFCFPYMETGKKLIDLGCGNGRDSKFFSRNGLNVTAIDSSVGATNLINADNLPIFTVCDDFTKAKVLFCVDYDYCYSRWSIHVINRNSQTEMFNSVYKSLKIGGSFFIEARTINDPKYGQGKRLDENEYLFDNHYRRFLDVKQVTDELIDIGFTIDFCEESNEFSILGFDKPALVRIIATKTK